MMWLELFMWSAVWILYHAILRYFFKHQPSEWTNKIVTVTHSLIICRLVEYYELSVGSPFDRIGNANTEQQIFLLIFTTGYFIYDTIWCIARSSEGPLMIIHHLTAAIGFPIVVLLGYGGAEGILALWGGELSNPFLQFRWLLKHYDYQNSKIALVNDAIFAIIFVFIRAVFMSKVFYHFAFQTTMPFYTKVMGFAFYAVGIIWCHRVIKFIRRKIF